MTTTLTNKHYNLDRYLLPQNNSFFHVCVTTCSVYQTPTESRNVKWFLRRRFASQQTQWFLNLFLVPCKGSPPCFLYMPRVYNTISSNLGGGLGRKVLWWVPLSSTKKTIWESRETPPSSKQKLSLSFSAIIQLVWHRSSSVLDSSFQYVCLHILSDGFGVLCPQTMVWCWSGSCNF
jgi:hypothetical protein